MKSLISLLIPVKVRILSNMCCGNIIVVLRITINFLHIADCDPESDASGMSQLHTKKQISE